MQNLIFVVQRSAKANPEALYRFYKDEKGSHEEMLDAYDNWVQDNSLITILNNLHNPYYEEITSEEAAQVVLALGSKAKLSQ